MLSVEFQLSASPAASSTASSCKWRASCLFGRDAILDERTKVKSESQASRCTRMQHQMHACWLQGLNNGNSLWIGASPLVSLLLLHYRRVCHSPEADLMSQIEWVNLWPWFLCYMRRAWHIIPVHWKQEFWNNEAGISMVRHVGSRLGRTRAINPACVTHERPRPYSERWNRNSNLLAPVKIRWQPMRCVQSAAGCTIPVMLFPWPLRHRSCTIR
jgi:hypothetical protein